MNIDIHAHIIPPEALREANPAEAWRPRVFRDSEGRQRVDHDGKVIGSAPREFVNIGQVLEEQEAAGIDLVVLSAWTSLLNYRLPVAEAIGPCRLQSEAIARYAREYPSRVAGMGIVPLQDARVAAKDAAYLVQELGLAGIEVGSNVNGTYLGEEALLPFWEAVADLDTLVFIHPVPGIGGPLMRQYDLGNSFGNPAETGLTAASLIFGGVLERFPTLKLCLAHGGGVLPYIIGRLDQGYRVRLGGKSPITRLPSSFLRQFYFDTITHSADALRYLIQIVGADHIVLGSDYPFDMGYERPQDLVASLDASRKDKDKILGENAARLLKLRVPLS